MYILDKKICTFARNYSKKFIKSKKYIHIC